MATANETEIYNDVATMLDDVVAMAAILQHAARDEINDVSGKDLSQFAWKIERDIEAAIAILKRQIEADGDVDGVVLKYGFNE